MTKVYIVIQEHYFGKDIISVFSKEKSAIELAHRNSGSNPNSRFYVKVFDLYDYDVETASD
jgi:hypothetical protein